MNFYRIKNKISRAWGRLPVYYRLTCKIIRHIHSQRPAFLYIFILVIFLLIGGISSSLMRKDSNQTSNIVPDTKVNKNPGYPPNKFSRISFFFGLPAKGSLAIPEYWEGNYRVQAGSDLTKISYISPQGEKDLFYIRSYYTPKWKALVDKSGEIVVKEESGQTFVYKAVKDNPFPDGVEHDKFSKMLAEIPEIISSYKVFK